MRRLWLLVFLMMAFSSTTVHSQVVCEEARTCANCIGGSGDCVWCSSPDFLGARCVNGSVNSSVCTAEYTVNPQGRILNLTAGRNSQMEQFTPLAADLELRAGVPQSFTVEVTPTANYPLDIYILMDFSNSMFDYIQNLRDVSVALANTLRNITSDFQIGFGSFIEKPIYPFTKVDNTRDPRTDYSFRHIVSLTENITTFQESIRSSLTLTNDDAPEALLEALLQSVVCKDVIGWRTEARKLVVVFTDALYHTAGDGKLAGIFQPHDGNCYVSRVAENLDYTMWGELDYPSIGQLRAKLQQNDIIPIFSTVSEVGDAYMNVVKQIPGAIFQSLGSRANRGQLDPDLYLSIIESSFNATSQRVELLPITDSESFIFNIEPTCPSGSMRNGTSCNGVLIGRTASFNLSVTLAQCPVKQQAIAVRIPGFGMISLRLSGVCECSCEREKDLNSSLCSSNGDHTCGVCVCHEQRFGERCQCDSPEAVNLPCPRGITLNSVCSSRGPCECGMCLCRPPTPNIVPEDIENGTYYGEGCECDNFSCPKGMDGLVCSGNGDCECHQACACHSSNISGLPLRGDACQCLPAEEVCFAPNSTLSEACSGHGKCRCEACLCDEGFEGVHCQTTTVNLQSCRSKRLCVECEEGIASSEVDCSFRNCTVIKIEPVETEEYFIDNNSAIQCSFLDSDKCLRVYYITAVGSSTDPIHSERPDCNGLAIPVWSIVVITLGGLLVLGILLVIIVKCILVCLDCYEVYRWEREKLRQEYGINDNPLYTNPDQKYDNIAYGLESPEREANVQYIGGRLNFDSS